MIERIKEKNGIEKEKESLELLPENCHFSLLYVHKIVVCKDCFISTDTTSY